MARTAKRELKFDLPPAIESLGLRTVLEQVGVDRVIEAMDKKEVIRRIGLDDFLANLSPAQRQELKRRLQ